MNKKETHQNLSVKRVMFTVAMAAGVCSAAWGQGTTTGQGTTATGSQGTLSTVVEVGSGVTKIAVGQDAATTVSNGVMVPATSGTTVSIEAEPVPGKAARLKLIRREDVDLSEHTSEGHVNDPSGQTGEAQVIDPSGQTGEGSVSQKASLKETSDIDETTQLKNLDMPSVYQDLPADINSQLTEGWLIIERMTLTLCNYNASLGDVTLNFIPKTKFTKDDGTQVLFAYPTPGTVSWFLVKGTGQADGSINIEIPANTCALLAGKTFVAFFLDC